jgi:hypothetical protein
MYQIVAVVLGWRPAEELLKAEDFKSTIVQEMIKLAKSGKYTLPSANDDQLRNGVGQIVNVSYGASLPSIRRQLNDDPGKYGTNWGTSKNRNLEHLLEWGAKTEGAIKTVVQMQDEYLQTARAIAEVAHQRDPFGGVAFRDPFDGELVRWNRPRWDYKKLPHGAVPLMIRVPAGEQNGDGEYEANFFGTPRKRKGSIRNLIAPALIHALDAAYASHVILKLHDLGVQDIVAINDCFLVPSDAEPALKEACDAAVEPWFRGLQPFYDVFENYLGDDPVHGPTVRRWKQAYLDRLSAIKAGRDSWPVFNFKTETTINLSL